MQAASSQRHLKNASIRNALQHKLLRQARVLLQRRPLILAASDSLALGWTADAAMACHYMVGLHHNLPGPSPEQQPSLCSDRGCFQWSWTTGCGLFR